MRLSVSESSARESAELQLTDTMGSSTHVASLRSRLEETLVAYHQLNATEWNVAKKSAKGRDRMEKTLGAIQRLSVSVKVKGLPWRDTFLQSQSSDRYKAEGRVTENHQRIVEYIRPGPYRLNWDSLMTSMEILQTLDKGSCIVKYTTAGQMWNIISPREFVDFSHTTDYESGLLSCGVSVEHDEHKQGFVRGFNHPCGWFCVPVENSSHSLLTGYIQTDLRGMLPQSAVDTAMASGLVNFYSDLRQALK